MVASCHYIQIYWIIIKMMQLMIFQECCFNYFFTKFFDKYSWYTTITTQLFVFYFIIIYDWKAYSSLHILKLMNKFWDIILNTLINCSRVVCQNWNLKIVSFVFYPIKRKEDKNSNDPIFPGYQNLLWFRDNSLHAILWYYRSFHRKD